MAGMPPFYRNRAMPSHRLDDIVCFEVGSGELPAWTGSRSGIGSDWPALEMQAPRGVIQIDKCGDRVAISGASRVGLVVLPSGRRLIVRSKIPSVTLLEWLAYLGDFPRLSAWLPDAGVSIGDDWPQCIAKLFLYALEYVTRRHMRKEYVAIAVDACEIRGRLMTTVLGQRLHHLPRIPQIQRRRTLDMPFNIVLALALDRLPNLLADCRGNEFRRSRGFVNNGHPFSGELKIHCAPLRRLNSQARRDIARLCNWRG